MKRSGDAGFSWERTLDRPWEAIVEDGAGGALLNSRADATARARAALRPRAVADNVQRGLVRYVLLVVDASAAAASTDVLPSRAAACESVAREFVRVFFDANPIAFLSAVVARGGHAERACELTGNPARVAGALRAALGSPPRCDGSFSFENVLAHAQRTFSQTPPWATREVIVLLSSIASIDAGDVLAAISAAAAAHVRVSVVSMAGEVYLAARVAAETGGAFSVPLDTPAISAELRKQVPPPPRTAADAEAIAARSSGLERVGFPELEHEVEALCACHGRLRSSTFKCPRCAARVCEVPSICDVCGLRLLSAPALARSYHHIFPVPAFIVDDAGRAPERGKKARKGAAFCAGCTALLGEGVARICPDCGLGFCDACDDIIHDVTHACPGCT
jgi:transcription initiation factor TFIIH subunit 2